PPAAPAAAPEPSAGAAEPGAPEAPKPKPPPYSLPFQLRPAAAATVIRSDTALAFYKPASSGGTTVATTLLGSFKVTPEFAPLVRLGLVTNSPPTPPPPPPGATVTTAAPGSGTAFMNPVLGAIFAPKLSPDLKLGLFLGVTVP